MDDYGDLMKKINMLSEEKKEVAKKLLNLISQKQHSNTRMEEEMKTTIREVVWGQEMK